MTSKIHPFGVGDHVQLRGPRRNLHTITLQAGEIFHTHKGLLRHDDIVGRYEGCAVLTDRGTQYVALRPLLRDFILSMSRGASIVYPKDAAHIVSLADICPGQVVVEAGVGSGALSLALLRALGNQGSLISVERRQEFADIAIANVEAFYRGKVPGWKVEVGDFQEVAAELGESSVDRVVLDMLAPWECVEQACRVLIPGGVLIVYVATVSQLSRTVEMVRSSCRFSEPESLEVIVRPWHVDGLAVRPEHRMIGHTGFLMSARLLLAGVTVEPQKRPKKVQYSEEDLELWAPGITEDRITGAKKTRKTVRKAQDRARKASQD